MVAKLKEAFRTHLELLASLTQQKLGDVQLDMAPDALSYKVANVMQVDLVQKQDLLETPTTEERIRKELRMLDKENGVLRLFQAMKDKGLERGDKPEGPFGKYISKN